MASGLPEKKNFRRSRRAGQGFTTGEGWVTTSDPLEELHLLALKHALKRALMLFAPSLALPHYDPRKHHLFDPLTHRLVSHSDLVVPSGQAIYDLRVFGRYDLRTHKIVSADDDTGRFDRDSLLAPAQALCIGREPISSDRYLIALRQLEHGSGLCLDACTAAPRDDVRKAITDFGYTYQAIDIRPGENVRQEDLTALSFETGSVARILSCDTLEHVPDYIAALREMHRVLEPGGMAIIHVPIYYVDRAEGEPTAPTADPWEHVRYFSARELAKLLKGAGFTVLRELVCYDYGAVTYVVYKGVQL